MRMTESPELSGTVVGAILGPGTSYREDWFDSWSWVVLYLCITFPGLSHLQFPTWGCTQTQEKLGQTATLFAGL